MTFALAAWLSAQPASPPPAQPVPARDPTAEAFEHLDAGRYLAAIDGIREAGRAAPEDSPLGGMWRQFHATIGGLVDPASLDRASATVDPQVARRLRQATRRDAIREIVERAKRTNIVILNEAHHSPRDRAFALEVARALRPLGYSILAAEAFTNSADEAEAASAASKIVADGYVRRSTGIYLSDPVFADFVRQAVALGYRPLADEQTARGSGTGAERIVAREQEQAENLVRRVFAREPKAKVLIYVGFRHVTEAPIGTPPIQWMAGRLKRMTGVDPLTIDQTSLSEMGEAPGRAQYELVRARIGKDPVVLVEGGKPARFGPQAHAVDLMVVHPPVRIVRGRPDWLRRIGRRPQAVPSQLLPGAGRRLVQAFVASEAADAIPLDQVIVEAGQPVPVLMLPPGVRVRYATQDPAR
jgi:hypothetical protein